MKRFACKPDGLTLIIAGLWLALSSSFAHGQITGHYAPGAEGIKGATLPPPGFYLRDYNFVYFSDRLNDNEGKRVPIKFHVSAYANVVRPVWMTESKIFGADYGFDMAVPFVYANIRAGAAKDHTFKPGDVFFRPLLLGWHPQQFDFVAAHGVWAPTGDAFHARLANPGKGFWSHMSTLGGTWYPDEAKSWALALVNYYEIHTRNHRLDITPGHSYTLEWGVSKTVSEIIDLGIVGYYQQQVTLDHGRGVAAGPRPRDHVVGVGAEVNTFMSQLPMFVSLRYVREFAALDRPEGNTITLTLTKRW